eukprot:scaffold789_cov125-Isochrysis_galbana.AAC.2
MAADGWPWRGTLHACSHLLFLILLIVHEPCVLNVCSATPLCALCAQPSILRGLPTPTYLRNARRHLRSAAEFLALMRSVVP